MSHFKKAKKTKKGKGHTSPDPQNPFSRLIFDEEEVVVIKTELLKKLEDKAEGKNGGT